MTRTILTLGILAVAGVALTGPLPLGAASGPGTLNAGPVSTPPLGAPAMDAPVDLNMDVQAAPPDPEAEVLEVIQQLFDAIEERDTEMAEEVLHPDGQVYRLPLPFEGVPEPASNPDFIEGLGEPGPDLLERMGDAEVLVHERMASAWTPYEFYADGEFSHCGVNAFNLIRDETGWRITGIVYTMEPDPDDCLEGLGPPA